MKRALLVIALLLLVLTLSGCAAHKDDAPIYKARVQALVDETYHDEAAGKYYRTQYLTLNMLDGPLEGDILESKVFIDAMNASDLALYRVGDTVEVFVVFTETGEVDYVDVHTLVRTPYAVALAVVFLVLLAAVSGRKGIKTILALVFTVSAVVFVLVPLIATGYDPIIAATLVCIIITLVTLLSVGGFNKKSLSAIIGTAGGLVCATVVTLIFSSLMRISGIDTPAVEMLMIARTDVLFNYQGILTAGILIGCIGAVMDVGMSISSAVNELHMLDPKTGYKQLFKSGISVGRDIIGTMANTLILAYTGGTIMMMVAWHVYGVSFADMLNKGYILIEVAKSLCGSIGMVMTIPLTAFVAARLIPARTGRDAGPDEGAKDTEEDATPLPPG